MDRSDNKFVTVHTATGADTADRLTIHMRLMEVFSKDLLETFLIEG